MGDATYSHYEPRPPARQVERRRDGYYVTVHYSNMSVTRGPFATKPGAPAQKEGETRGA